MRNAAILAFAGAVVSAATALLAAFRERRSTPKFCFVAGMLLLSLESFFAGMAANTDSGGLAIRYWHEWEFAAKSLLPGTWLLFSLTYARGNAREFLEKWRPLIVGAFVLPVAILCLFYKNLLTVDFMSIEPGLRLVHLTMAGLMLYMLFLVASILVLVSLEHTFRASIGTMRWRIKFMVLGLGILFAVRVYTSSQALLWPRRGIDESIFMMNSIGLLLGCAMTWRSLLRKPMEVAVYPPLTLLQNSLTFLLAGVYLLVVGVFAKIVEWIGGDASFQAKTFIILVALVGLATLWLSDRVRLHLRRLVSRYLQRPLYDYRTVWRSCSEAIASRVTQQELCEAAVKQVAGLFQALSVTIWLVDDKRENLVFAASTSLLPAAGEELAPKKDETARIIRAFENDSEPREIETSGEDWAVILRRCHPKQFLTGGSRVSVPMMAGQHLMGVLTLGDRVGGIFFSLQDFDLLKCVGDQVAGGLLNVQLSHRLLQNKEMEAFQTMSAFFVHDLKNTANTLNLMLKNLPVHFDNPAFREDALRGVAKTSEHINHLITRLSQLRHDLRIIKPAEADLNDVVTGVLSSWEAAAKFSLIKDFHPCPKVLMDQEQFSKVVTNLVLNATEAVPSAGGEIKVGTVQSNGWAVLTISDNGCGMAPEFLRTALFRPFQTTKKNGFGIGMFQSKMIVEAHGGRIEVESEPKKGTTFRVLLPVPKQSK
jgi:putative PEP-CTERM system histidine kinase